MELIRIQYNVKDQFERAKINFKKSPKDRITQHYVEKRLETVEEKWKIFTNNHYQIVKSKEDLSQEDYFTENEFENVEEFYLDFSSELRSILSIYKSMNIDHSDQTTANKNKVQQIKLPKITIPVFSGNYMDWTSFRDLFTSLVHANDSLDNVQKLHYLKSHLSGEAEQLLRHIPITNENYMQCWSLLEHRYNNKQYLANNILKRFFSLRNVQTESSTAIKELLDTTTDTLNGLQGLGIDVKSWDIIIIYIVSLKLDQESRKLWESKVSESVTSSAQLPSFAQFKEFLETRYHSLEFLDPKSKSCYNNYGNRPKNVVQTLHTSSQTFCPYCKKDHKLSNCKLFATLDCELKRNFVQENRLCFNCLANNHSAKHCKSTTSCQICKRRHHSQLHPKSVPQSTDNRNSVDRTEHSSSHNALVSSESEPSTSIVNHFSTRAAHQVLLATALVKAESRNGQQQWLRALIDQGSQASFITEAAVQLLKLKKTATRGTVSGLGGEANIVSKAMVEVKIHSRHDPCCVIEVKAYVLERLTALLPATKINTEPWPELQRIKLADPGFNTPNKIDILLGAEVYGQIISDGLNKLSSGSLVLQDTTLGWIISGQVLTKNKIVVNHFISMHSMQTQDLLKAFWEVEDKPTETKKLLTDEEQRCEEFFDSTTTRDEEGRYVVCLPFRSEDPECKYGHSRDIAVKRFLSLEAKLKKTDLKKRYKEVIDEYLQLGHMEKVPENDERKPDAVYLPHHAVVRSEKDTTKVRVVFDASCKGKNGTSLNDDLMIGPPLQSELRHLIMRWRSAPICIAADIEKMYRQVIVDKQHTEFQRIVWRDDVASEIKEYRLLRVTFGTSSAPYLAVKALQQVALDDGHNYPLVSKRIITDFYVDDYLTNCESVDEGIKVYEQTHELLSKAGFKLKKWTSNSDQLLNEIKVRKDKEPTRDELNIKLDESIKILGLTWNRGNDAFRYTVQLPELEHPVTKRKIISDIARLYDPLGWIAPSIITAKIFIQKLWLSGVDWDEEIPPQLLNEWVMYRKDLEKLINFRLPRWMNSRSSDVFVELHGFCDASNAAFGAVVYLRVTDLEGRIHVSLLTAKTKVAPIKQISVPRLELCGAVLLTKLLVEVSEVLEIPIDHVHAWTDSEVVLAWLSSHPSRWKTFIGNRVSEIVSSLERSQWSHVRSEQNPADCASRGVKPSEIANHHLWLNGPLWLKNKVLQYDKQMKLNTNLEERTIKSYAAVESQGDDIWSKYSSLTRLLRVVAYCRRFLKKKEKHTYLLKEEIDEALDTMIKKCQNDGFSEEISNLNSGKIINKKSQLTTLNPFLDELGILRVGGRLQNAQLHENRKHPILIPHGSFLAKLIVADAHKRTLHGGPQLMLNYLNSKYWILGVKRLVKAHMHKCVTCVKNTAATRNQLMGQLPAARVTPTRPFKSSGVDYAGPIQIRTSKGRGHHASKGYLCIFVCMSTRAMHLEAVTDLTAHGFLQAFKRFVGRRGHCKDIWSDNGTNFIAAASELNKLFNAEKSTMIPEVAESLATNGTSWHFIPPHSPNFGGLWEAGVKSVKYHLKRVIGNATLTYEEISTVLVEIESCLNSRPLSQITSEDGEVMALTPGHFLIGEPLLTAPDKNYEESNISSLRRWQMTQKILQHFWRRWSQEYLTRFLHRHKWEYQTIEPKIGDIVLVKEDGLPPSRWLLGKVVEKHPGLDKVTRVVSLRCKNNIIKRPTSKICVLPVAD